MTDAWQPMDITDRVAEIVDELERYRAAIKGQSDLKIGPNTVAWAFEKSIGAMLDARTEIIKLREQIEKSK